jgi:hypothetical protein
MPKTTVSYSNKPDTITSLSGVKVGNYYTFDKANVANKFTTNVTDISYLPTNLTDNTQRYIKRTDVGGSDHVTIKIDSANKIGNKIYVTASELLTKISLETGIETPYYFEWKLEEPVQSGGYRKKSRKSRKNKKSRKQRKTRRS